jgi:hypothetical protein
VLHPVRDRAGAVAGDPLFDHVEGEVEGGVSDRVQGKRPSGRVGAQDAAAQALLVFLEVAVVAGTAFVGLTQLGGAAQDRSVREDLDRSELEPLIAPSRADPGAQAEARGFAGVRAEAG